MKNCTPHYWWPGWFRGRSGAMWVEGIHVSIWVLRLTVRVWLKRGLWFWGRSPVASTQIGPLELSWDSRQ